MKSFSSRFGLAIVFVLLFASGLAVAELRIAVPRITNLLEADQSGVYQRIMEKALVGIDMPVRQEFFPYKRANLLFEKGQFDCIYSMTDVMAKKLGKNRIVASFPLGAFAYHMFTLKTTPVLTLPSQLLGKRVSGVIGQDAYYRDALLPETNLMLVLSDEQNLKLLRQRRIDVMIAALPDISTYVSELAYSPNHPLFKGYDRMTCHKTDESKRFVDALSRQLKLLKQDGTYQRLAGRLFVDFDADDV
ncbi:transporter substrate-binding domain-containing protein [Marinobacteraceae bacterium S3BR75-40.1]